jgi:hypothetical protein
VSVVHGDEARTRTKSHPRQAGTDMTPNRICVFTWYALSIKIDNGRRAAATAMASTVKAFGLLPHRHLDIPLSFLSLC